MKLFFKIIVILLILAAAIIFFSDTKDELDKGQLDIGNLTKVVPKDSRKTPEQLAAEAAAARAEKTQQAQQAATQAIVNMKSKLEAVCAKHNVELSDFQVLGGGKYRLKLQWRGDIATWGGDVIEDAYHGGIIGADFETISQKNFRNQFGKNVYSMELKVSGA